MPARPAARPVTLDEGHLGKQTRTPSLRAPQIHPVTPFRLQSESVVHSGAQYDEPRVEVEQSVGVPAAV